MHFKKFRKRENKFVIHKMAPYIVLTVVLGLSIAYSSFASNMNLAGLLTTVRIEKDVRVTGVSVVGEDMETICNLISDNGDVGLSVGDEYSCEVKEDTWYTFHVISTNNASGEIITSGSTDTIVTSVNLMLNSNVYYKSETNTGLATTENLGTIAWYWENSEKTSSKGPVTAMTYLYNATKDWTNLGNININYTDARTSYTMSSSGATTTITSSDGTETATFDNLKARMAIKSELDAIVNNFDFYLDNITLTSSYGYWLLNGIASGTNAYAYRVNSAGIATNSSNVTSQFGVRPVITVYKPEMETSSGESSTGNGGESTYQDYNINNISSGIRLPEEDSSVTFNVEITNIGNAEVGIVDITGLPDNLTYELLDYELKERICDRDSQCSLGIKKYIQIEVKYKTDENGNASAYYDKNNTYYDIVLDFDFQQFYPIEYINIEKSPCGLVLGDGKKIGDIVQCGTEQFYVMENDGTNITMLTAGVIKPSETDPGQSSNFMETVAFSQDSYWYDSTNKVYLIDNDYSNEEKSYPYIYGEYEGNLIYPYVNAYEDYLINDLKIESASATIMSYEQAVSLGCIDDVGCAEENGGKAPKWLAYPGHWLGSALRSSLWRIGTLSGFNAGLPSHNQYFSIRPVVTIEASEIGNEYPLEVLGGEDLTITFSGNAPSGVIVKIGDEEITDYTYSNGVLTIENVNGNVEIIKDEPIVLAQYITDLYNNSTTKTNSLEVDGITYSLDTTNNLMDDRLGGTVSSGGNIRYYGANPNNYVDIGDRDSSDNVILWRIIGVFETKYATTDKPCDTDSDGDLHYDNCATDKLVKIIRADSIRDYVWDYTSSGSYTNNWSTATLNTMLNGAYYNSTTTSYYNRTKPTSVDFTSNGLSANAQSKVENVLWNLGGTSTYEIPYTNDWYVYERGTTRYTGNPIEWVGKIGLMYPSDYGYGADLGQCNKEPYNYDTTTSCKGTDWISINQWTITPISNYWSGVFAVGSPGNVSHCDASNPIEVRPVLYLKSDVSIVGTGTTSGGISYYVVE